VSRSRIILAGAAAALAVAAALLGGVLTESNSAATSGAPAATAVQFSADHALSGFSLGNTEGTVLGLQDRLRKHPRDARSYALLGFAYQQRARETGDPSYYPRAAEVLGRAHALAPRSELASSGLASLALSRHRFRDALYLSRRAQTLAPYAARNYGLLGDAFVELGRYAEAFRAYDSMSRLKPNLASYARVSYGRELVGRQEAASRRPGPTSSWESSTSAAASCGRQGENSGSLCSPSPAMCTRSTAWHESRRPEAGTRGRSSSLARQRRRCRCRTSSRRSQTSTG
jgi:tetratricopeptide (TPR) repeat protein